jgi:cytochrome c-type biogenesis protein CcmH/NrfG
MTKEELIAKMAASAGITKVAAGTALQAFTGAVRLAGELWNLYGSQAESSPRQKSQNR